MNRSARLLAGLILLIALWPAAALAQTAEGSADDPLDQIQILDADASGSEVSLTVAVPTAVGALAPTSWNFGVVDGDEVVGFSVTRIEETVDVVIAIDTSESMADDPLASAKRAAAAFVQGLDPSARVGLVSFGATATVRRQPTTEHQAILDDLGSLEAIGETALWDGVVEAARVLGGSAKPFVIVLSDGKNTVGAAEPDDAIAALDAIDGQLYAIGIESTETNLVALKQVADRLGDQYFDIDDIGELEPLYADIASRLGNRYEIVYPSTRTDRREVNVSVATGPDAVAIAQVVIGDEPSIDQTGGEGEEGDAGIIGSEDPSGDPSEESMPPAPVLNLGDDGQLGVVTVPEVDLLASGTVIWVGAGAFFAAFAIVGILLVAPAARARFPSAAGADRVAGWNSRLSALADRLIAARDQEGALDEALDTAGLDLRPGEFVLLVVGGTGAAGLVASATSGIAAGLVAVPVVASAIAIYLRARIKRRRRQFANQLGDTLTILVGGLRAGRGIGQAIELVSQETSSPTREQFGRVVFETRIGRDMVDSLASVAKRMANRELEWVSRAIDVNRELGGDLTETLRNVAETIRDRRRVERQVQALSAEGRASGWVMLSLPPAMFLVLIWRTPNDAALLFTDPTGRILLGVGGIGMLAGYLWIRRLIDLEY